MVLRDIDYDFMAQKILYSKYFEDRARKKDLNEFPQEIKKIINERIDIHFKEHAKIKGEIPYIFLANVYGIEEKIRKEDEDGFIFVVAPPGYGKTSVSLMGGKFTDKTLRNNRVIFNIDELKKFLKLASEELLKEKEARLAKGVLYESPLKGKVVVLDEGVFMMFSGDAMTREGKLIQKLVSIIRALNLMVFVNVTNFKKVNKGVKEDRIILLIRISRRGIIEGYSKKKIRQILIMPDGIKWPRPNFTERVGFIDPACNYWQEYEIKKADFLFNSVENDK